MLKYKVFVINLARSPERLAAIKAQLDAIGVPFERVDAYDGKNLSDDFIEQASPAHVVRQRYFRALSKSEVACSLSHKKAWQQIIDSDLDFGIVLEDDVELLDNFADVLELLSTLPRQGWDFIKLFPLRRGGDKNIAKRVDYKDHTFVTYHRYPLGFQCQAISRQGAKSMIRNLSYVTEPADSQLKSWWEAGVYPFGLVPYCVAHDNEGASDINPGGALEGMRQSRYAKIVNKIKRASMRLWSTPKLNRKFRAFADSLNHEN